MNVVERIRSNVVALAGMPPQEALTRMLAQRIEWNALIKTVRQLYDIDLPAAERLVLTHAGWRRWCAQRINREAVCRKAAFRHLRHRGADALLARDGDRYVIPAPA